MDESVQDYTLTNGTLNRMIKKSVNSYSIALIIFFLFASFISKAQLKLGSHPTELNKAALLELESGNQGLRLPHVDTNAINKTIDDLLPSRQDSTNGMVIFQPQDSSIYYRSGGYWKKLIPSDKLNHFWKLTGNKNTNPGNTSNPGTDFIGTLDQTDLLFKTNNQTRLRLKTSGTLETTNPYNSVMIGHQVGWNLSGATALRNVFVGYRTGYSNTSGSDNTFVGYYAGKSVTKGTNNTFIGGHTGNQNAAGSYNTFLGFNAGYSNNGGNSNVFVGYKTGQSNTTGDYNTYSGVMGGYNSRNVSGNANFGYKAGYNNDGNNNTFIGRDAGHNSTKDGNTIVGAYAGYNNKGGSNSFFGYYAGDRVKGDHNSFFGYEAGKGNDQSTGNNNTFNGYKSGHDFEAGTENAFYGFESGYNNSDGNYNTFVGSKAGYDNATGNSNVAIGYESGVGNRFQKSIALGAGASTKEDAAIAIGYGASVSAKNAVAIGTGVMADKTNTLILGDTNVKVGIHTNDPQYTLDVHGTGSFSGPLILGNELRGSNGEGSSGQVLVSQGTNAAPQWRHFGIKELSDIAISSLSDGDVLQYDQSSGKWINAGISSGGSGSGWGLNGNSISSGDFLGTTNYQALIFKVKKEKIAYFGTPGEGHKIIFGNGSSAGYTGLVFGSNSLVNGNNAIALGNDVSAGAQESVALGYGASTSGNNSIAIGKATTNGQNGIAIGNGASIADNNTVAVGSGASASSFQSVAIGNNATAKTGNNTLAMGVGSTASGGNATAVGNDATASGRNATAVGYGASASQANTLILGDKNVKVGIRTNDPQYALEVNGDIKANNVSVPSDIRFKKKWQELQDVLSVIDSLHGYTYFFRTEKYKNRNFPSDRQIGMIAQEIEKYFPELVTTDNNGYKSLNYAQFSAVLLTAVKEQQEEIKQAKQQQQSNAEEIDSLKKQMQLLMQQTKSLQQQIEQLQQG